MTKEEAKREIEKVFEPAFANYIVTALTDGATESDFPAMLSQYLFENDQMIIGKDVYEELKYEVDEYDELMRQYKHLRKYASDLETKLSVEPQGEAISREAVLDKIAEIDKLSKAGKTDEALALMKEFFEILTKVFEDLMR